VYNAREFRRLLAKRNAILEEKYAGSWENTPSENRGGTAPYGVRRPDFPDGREPGRVGKGGDFVCFAPFPNLVLDRVDQAEWFQEQLLVRRKRPEDHPVGDDWKT